eukprot:3304855-Amphidinium_carterae.1
MNYFMFMCCSITYNSNAEASLTCSDYGHATCACNALFLPNAMLLVVRLCHEHLYVRRLSALTCVRDRGHEPVKQARPAQVTAIRNCCPKACCVALSVPASSWNHALHWGSASFNNITKNTMGRAAVAQLQSSHTKPNRELA